jgi:hypothetical protein
MGGPGAVGADNYGGLATKPAFLIYGVDRLLLWTLVIVRLK